MNDVGVPLDPQFVSVVMFSAFAAAIAGVAGLWFSRRMNQRCEFGCGNLHPKRPKDMTAIKFIRTYCRRFD
jgi:hypothetical protein